MKSQTIRHAFPSLGLIVGIASIIFIALTSLTACSESQSQNGDNSQQASSEQFSSDEHSESANNHTSDPSTTEESPSSEGENEMATNQNENGSIILSVNGTELTATLENNSSADALVELLEDGPLTISMSDYAHMEKVGPIGQSLPRNDTPTNTEAGDIILYQGNQLTVYYDHNSWNFTRIGKIQNVNASELRSILGSGDATITFSLA